MRSIGKMLGKVAAMALTGGALALGTAVSFHAVDIRPHVQAVHATPGPSVCERDTGPAFLVRIKRHFRRA